MSVLLLRVVTGKMPVCFVDHRIVAEAMQTLDYNTERFGTIKEYIDNTSLAYSGFSKGVAR